MMSSPPTTNSTTITSVKPGVPLNKQKNRFKAIEPYLWLAPCIALMAIFIAVPIFTVFRISFSKVGRTGKIGELQGFENYEAVFKQPAFWRTLQNTIVWTVVVVGLSTIIGFILAMVLNQKFKGRKFVRAVVIFPWATALIIQSVIWRYIINADYGALNVLLKNLGIINSFVNWTSTANSMFAWECWVGIFVTVPFVTFCVLSGLQSIDHDLYEAADVDGAGFWSKLWNITIPLVTPSLTVSTVLNIIYVFNSFPIVWTISKGAPADQTHTIVTYLYQLAFIDGRGGYAAAVSVIGFVILAVVASIYMIVSLRNEEGTI